MSDKMTLEQVRNEISDHLSDGNRSSPSDETLHDWIDVIDAHLNAAKGESVAWMTEDGRVAKDTTKQCMPRSSKEVFCIPLYTHPSSLDDVRDAERYRWLRNKSYTQWDHPICVSQERVELGIRYICPLVKDVLDQAIDAAMAAREGGE